MEPLFELVGAWWWVAPTVVGLGAVSYGVLTTGRRRARRLELDAARHEVATAHTALVTARADARSAQAQLLAAQASHGAAAPGIPSVAAARHALQDAKRRQRVASMTLRAKRSAVRAAKAQLAAPALPLARLMAQHDAVTTRWLEYETDVAKTIAFPQMTDVRHPPTAEFLHAQREARRLRPESDRARISPEEYIAYRDAVQALEVAFVAAEQDAWRAASREAAPAPTWTARIADGIVRLPAVVSEVSDSVRAAVDQAAAAASASATRPRPAPDAADTRPSPAPEATAPRREPETTQTRAPATAPPDSDPRQHDPRPPVWPVPSRTSRPPTSH